MRGALRAITRPAKDEVASLAAEIEAERLKASEAVAEIERLEQERRSAESYEQARATEGNIARLRWAVERADATIPRLEQQLAAAKQTHREAAFRRHRKFLVAAGRKVMLAAEALAEANEAVVATRQAAVAELGDIRALPALHFAGIALPDAIRSWMRNAERVLDQFETAEPPRPQPVAPPRVPGAAPAPARPVLVTARPVVAAAPPPAPAPALPPPPPVRKQRRDGPPGEGEKQFHFMANGIHQLPDGSMAAPGDYVNVPAEVAERFARAGVGDIFNVPTAAAAEAEPALATEVAANG